MASCSLCRRNHLFFRSIWISHTDVIQDALLEQERILKYEADLIHQRIQRNVPNVNAADLNTSVRHIIKPGDQAGDGTLTATGGADNGCHLALIRKERNMRQGLDLGIGFVGKADILKSNPIVFDCCRRTLFGQDRDTQDFIHTLHAAVNLREGLRDIHDLIQDAGNRMDNNQVENECQRILPEIRGVHPNQNAHGNQKQINIVDDRGKSRHTVLPAQCVLQHERGIVCNGFAQPLKGIGGLIKCFDLRHTAHIFHGGAVHVFLGGLETVHFFLCLSVETRKLHDKGQNNTDQTNHTIPPVNSKKNDDQNKRRDQRGHKVRELVSDEFLNAFNVFVHDFSHFAAAQGQMIPKGNLHDVVGKGHLQFIKRSKRRNVGTQQGKKVKYDVPQNSSQGQPSPGRNRGNIQERHIRVNKQDFPNDVVD